MRFFLGLFFLFCVVFGILHLLEDNNDYDPNWNNNCEYGNEYIMPDGTVVHHSDCK